MREGVEVLDTVGDWVGCEAEAQGLAPGLLDTVELELLLAPGVALAGGLALRTPEALSVAPALVVREASSVLLGDGAEEALPQARGLREGEALPETLPEPVALRRGLRVACGWPLTLGEGEGDCEAEAASGEGEAVRWAVLD